MIRDERGGALAEMAVLLIPFILMIAMIIEGGNILWRHQTALKAARDVTRFVSRAPLLFDEDCALNDVELATTIASAKLLGSTGFLGGGSALVPGWTTDNIEVAPPTVIQSSPCQVLVQASASVDLALPFAPIFRLFDPSQEDVITFTVSDRTRWLGE
jgi:Flp pilus assembly protein TadG